MNEPTKSASPSSDPVEASEAANRECAREGIMTTTEEHLQRLKRALTNHPQYSMTVTDALESLTALRKTFEEFRDWSKVAHGFAWAHERTCPRHDADLPCDCGLDAFLSRPRPIAEGFRQEIATLTAELSETKSAMEAYAAESDAFCERTKVLTAERDKAIRDPAESEQKVAAAQAEREEVLHARLSAPPDSAKENADAR